MPQVCNILRSTDNGITWNIINNLIVNMIDIKTNQVDDIIFRNAKSLS